MQLSPDPIRIQLRLKTDFNTYQDIQRIFSSFSIVSWLANTYKVRVHTRFIDPVTNFKKTIFSFTDQYDNEKTFYSYQMEKNNESFYIKYALNHDQQEFIQKNIITLNIYIDKLKQIICIEVKDQSGFLNQHFPEKIEKIMGKESNSYIKQNQLKYCYIESEDERHRIFQKPHFSLAFQGGGAKGLAYIGAYKSLIQTHPQTQIRSVIGSSAGSIIALAISAGNSVQSMTNMMSQLQYVSNHKIIKQTKDITQQKKDTIKKTIASIRQILHQYGLVYYQLFDLIVQQVLTQEVIQIIFKIICGNNIALKQIFSIDIEQTHPVILNWKKSIRKLQNYFGFFEGSLLKSTIIQQLSVNIISGLFVTKITQNKDLVQKTMGSSFQFDGKQLSNKKFQQISRTLTLKQLYALTQIQFTCTAVDIQDKIIRFFNHKTTPDLPAHIAVQLSSSFPVVFQAQKWKKQWGYYFIHHHNRRIQIDLTGHRFTDGGVLANFPIQYLDNQMMRPKYFSHKPNQYTKVFGFGLHFVKQEQKSNKQQQNQISSQYIQKLKKLLINNFPKNKFFLLELTKKPKPQQIIINNLPSLKQIPIVQFLLSLLQTYQYANDNLVRECFFFESYIFTEDLDLYQQVQNEKIDILLQKYRCLGDIFSKLRTDLTSIPFQIDIFDKRIQKHQQGLKSGKINATQITKLTDFVKRIIIGYGKFSSQKGILIRKPSSKNTSSLEYISSHFYKLMKQLNQMYKRSFFIKVLNIKRKSQLLLNFLQKIKLSTIIKSHKEESQKQFISNHLIEFLEYTRQSEDSKIKTILSMIGQIRANMLSYKVQSQSCGKIEDFCKNSFNNKLFRYIIDFMNGFTDPYLPQFEKFGDKLKMVDLPHLKINFSIHDQTTQIWRYIRDSIQRKEINSNDIHLVFQGHGNCSNYYFQTYHIVNQFLAADQSQKQILMHQKIAKLILDTQPEHHKYKIKSLPEKQKKYILRKLSHSISVIRKSTSINVNGHSFDVTEEVKQKLQAQMSLRKKNMKKISAITCGNLHSILGFLISAGFSDDRIQQQLKHIKYLTHVSKDINKKYYEKDWVNPTNYQMRQLQDKIWQERYQLFEQLQKIAENDETLLKNINAIKYEFNQSKQLVVNGFEQIMDFLIEAEVERSDTEDLSQYFSKKLLLKTQECNFYKEAKNVSNGAQKLIFEIVDMFSEQINLLMISALSSVASPFTQRIQRQNDPKVRKRLWRGFLIDVFMEASDVKKKMFDLLEQLHLPKDISLKQFYEIAPKKLQLNFIAVELKLQKICIINRHTYPSMALWAAILISASYPPFYKVIRAKQQWLQQIHQSFKQKAINQAFKDSRLASHRIPIFVSGNLLASFPLSLLHNQKVQKMYLMDKKYVFLSFGINLKDNSKKQSVKMVRSFASLCDLLKIGKIILTSFLKGMQFKPTFDFFAINDKLKIINTYMDSNDQLMLQLYKDNLLLLPIRFNTLDFHKLGQTQLINLTIQQSYLMTIQKLSIIRQVFFKIKLIQDQIIIYFLSRDLNNQNDSTKYNIFYSQPPQKGDNINFISIKKQLKVKSKTKYFYLRFEFIKKKTEIKHTVFKISFQNLAKDYQRLTAIYELQYDTVSNKYIYPLFITDKVTKLKQDNVEIKIESILNIQADGLYCQRCCFDMNPQSHSASEYKQIFVTNFLRKQCYHCKQQGKIRFKCPECFAYYCVLCTNNLILDRTADQHCLVCFRKHGVHYIFNNSAIQQNTFTICDNCRQYTEDYYLDEECNINLCYHCANTILQ